MTLDRDDTSAGGSATEDAQLHRDSARIEQLLDELKAMVGPPALQRIEELVTALVTLYGAGLERMVRAAREAARDPGELAGRLCGDELLSSLLMLHDLHPRGLTVDAAIREDGLAAAAAAEPLVQIDLSRTRRHA